VNILYGVNKEVNAEEVSEVFKKSGIKRPIENLERIRCMINNSNLIVTAWDGDVLIGIARALTDFSWSCYLSDLAVDIDYQKRGIGKELVRLVKESIGEEVVLLLLSAPSAMSYYPQIGFESTDRAYIIPRKR
jgi:predicted N-acetyltransferase YhbS